MCTHTHTQHPPPPPHTHTHPPALRSMIWSSWERSMKPGIILANSMICCTASVIFSASSDHIRWWLCSHRGTKISLHFTYPIVYLTVGAPRMIRQPLFSIHQNLHTVKSNVYKLWCSNFRILTRTKIYDSMTKILLNDHEKYMQRGQHIFYSQDIAR